MLGFNDYLTLVEDHTPTFAVVHSLKGETVEIGCTCKTPLAGDFSAWQVHHATEIHGESLYRSMYGDEDLSWRWT